MKILVYDIERRIQLLVMSRNPQLAQQAQQIAAAQQQINQGKAMMMANAGPLTTGQVPGAPMMPPPQGPPPMAPVPPQT